MEKRRITTQARIVALKATKKGIKKCWQDKFTPVNLTNKELRFVPITIIIVKI